MTLKHLLNKLIDEAVHPKGRPKTVEDIIKDEFLHILVEGEFRADKFLRYQIAPLLKPKRGRKGRKRRQ